MLKQRNLNERGNRMSGLIPPHHKAKTIQNSMVTVNLEKEKQLNFLFVFIKGDQDQCECNCI